MEACSRHLTIKDFVSENPNPFMFGNILKFNEVINVSDLES